MSFIGTVGVVAQQGNQGGVVLPSEPYLAVDSSSSNGGNSIITRAFGDVGYQNNIHFQGGGDFSGGSISTQLDINELNNFSAANYINIYVAAYLHGYSSYSYAITSLTTDIDPNDATPTIVGTSSTSQDSTFSNLTNGIGKSIKIDAGGGRGGLTWGTAGEYIQFVVTGTDAVRDTDSLTVLITWTAGDPGD